MTHRRGRGAGGPGEDGGCGDAVVPAQDGPGRAADQGARHVVAAGVQAGGPCGAVAGAAHVAQAISAFQLTTAAGKGKAVAASTQLLAEAHE